MKKAAKKRASARERGICKLLIALTTLLVCLAGALGCMKQMKLGLDLAGGVSITYQTLEADPSDEDMRSVMYKLQKRVDRYSTEAEVYREGTNQINVDIPGVREVNNLLNELGAPGTLQFVDQEGNVLLTGEHVAGAKAGYRKNTTVQASEYVVELVLNDEGRALFSRATKENIGKTIRVIYDGEVINEPMIDEVITEDTCYIENVASMAEAEQLAMIIRIGALPLELKEVRSTIIGAKLGEEALETSLKAGAVGLMIIIVLLCLVYRIPGVAATLALLFYVALVIISIKGLDITLTLPGIAGIVLGIGMAVDANVIIFARIREEFASGASVHRAVQNGFLKARTAIVDGNITTLIAATILLWMGGSMVRGFAETLALGIVISMFTAMVVTKIVLIALYEVGFQNEVFWGKSKSVREIDFVGYWRYFMLSGVLLVAGVGGVIVYSFSTDRAVWQLGLEFQGGTATTILFDEAMSLEQIAEDVLPAVRASIGDGQIEAQKVADTEEVIFKTHVLTQTEEEKMLNVLQEQFSVKPDSVSSEYISATISEEMRRDAGISIVVALICMMMYIWFRFKKISFGISAMMALFHDVLALFAVYGIFQLVVGNACITCVLTIIGYSINATIVVFDRIRERMQKNRERKELRDLVNQSITETLERSVYTSLTTWIMAAALYVFGVSGVREFALPLMIGIFCGTYSSICLAGTTWYQLCIKQKKKSEM